VQIYHSRTEKSMAYEPAAKDLSYDDITALKQRNEIILIDVREPSEIKETGRLPGSVHIPRKFLNIHLQYVPDNEKGNSTLTICT
jgi:rhodanese-related sulfurtransferase